VKDLRYNGKPLKDTQKLRVAMNNYRYSGGGAYNFKGLPIVYRSSKEIRDLIIDYLTRTGVIPTKANGNWRIEPQEAVEALRRTVLEQEHRATQSSRIFPDPLFNTIQGRGTAMLARPEHDFNSAAGN
jgi:hypothetical protein